METQAPRNVALPIAQWRELTREGAFIPVRIQLNGVSMQPLIRRNRDHVTIHPLQRPLRRGDVVLFADDLGRYVVHRVRKVYADRVITLGDNCKNPDAPLRHSQIWGLVTLLERGQRKIRLDSPWARAYGRFWMGIFPLRKLWRKARSFAGRIYRKLRGR